MTERFSNITGLDLSVAVWLADDPYKINIDTQGKKHISVTSLIKPIRALILANRVTAQDGVEDISARLKARIGQAVHSAVEFSWADDTARHEALKKLGYPKKIRDKIVVNPTEEQLQTIEGIIPVYIEQRFSKIVGDWIVSGQVDLIIEGILHDVKSTSTYTYTHDTKSGDYIRQGSLYRWLEPNKITKDWLRIQFLFTDWSKHQARSNKQYPQVQIMGVSYNLATSDQVQNWVERRLATLDELMDAPEEALPECTPDELWQSESVFKYYKNPANRNRSTANFSTEAEALSRKIAEGNVGVVVEVKGQAKACNYCAGAAKCNQRQRLIAQGLLEV